MSFASLARHEREIGHVVAVTGTRVTLELHPEGRSPVHAYPGGLSTVTQIGAYVLFPVGAGDSCVGVLTGAYEHEGYEPEPEEGMTLRLAKPRRTLRANLLGSLGGDDRFRHGVTVYPSLGTVVLIPSQKQLEAVLRETAQVAAGNGVAVELGNSPIYETIQVAASLDDLFSRPLAIVGNTGSGKSWTVAALIQGCTSALARRGDYRPKFVVLDINGEYSPAFGIPIPAHRPNEAYLDGRRFILPLWTLNLEEFIRLFGATEATQVPVLERVVTLSRERGHLERTFASDPAMASQVATSLSRVDRARRVLEGLRDLSMATQGPWLGRNVRKMAAELNFALSKLPGPASEAYATALTKPTDHVTSLVGSVMSFPGLEEEHHVLPGGVVDQIADLSKVALPALELAYDRLAKEAGLPTITADAPFPFPTAILDSTQQFDNATAGMRGQERIREYVATMRLRIRRLLQDRRWDVFTTECLEDLPAILAPLVGSDEPDAEVVIIDCAMLSYDVLPFFCSVLGRTLLDLRQYGGARQRLSRPWVLVLEEAHNYLRPRREGEEHGTALSRSTFERIAKEGRKFGLSLIIASQRPSDVSQTVLAQCANFIVHRIQNPDDIEYFRRILPAGFREVLDQVGVLVAGEALLMGSAVNVPSRVRIWPPSPAPHSETPQPCIAWRRDEPDFDYRQAIANWRGEPDQPAGDEDHDKTRTERKKPMPKRVALPPEGRPTRRSK